MDYKQNNRNAIAALYQRDKEKKKKQQERTYITQRYHSNRSYLPTFADALDYYMKRKNTAQTQKTLSATNVNTQKSEEGKQLNVKTVLQKQKRGENTLEDQYALAGKDLTKEYQTYLEQKAYEQVPQKEKEYTDKLKQLQGLLSQESNYQDERAQTRKQDLQTEYNAVKTAYDAFKNTDAAKRYQYDQRTKTAEKILQADKETYDTNTDGKVSLYDALVMQKAGQDSKSVQNYLATGQTVRDQVQMIYDVEHGDYGITDENGNAVNYNSVAAKKEKDKYYPLIKQKKEEAAKLKQQLADNGYDVDALLDVYTRQQNAKQRQAAQAAQEELAEESPVMATIASWATNILSGVAAPDVAIRGYLPKGMEEMVTGEINPVDPNSPHFNAVNATNTMRTTVENNLEEEWQKFLYRTGISIADSATAAPLAAFGLFAQGSNAAADAALHVSEKGGTAKQSLLTGMAAGVSEAMFEKISLGQLKAFKASNKTGLVNAVKNVMKGAFTEGSEEVATDVANLIADSLINTDNADFNRAVQSYEQAGYTEEEAWKQAFMDTLANIGQSFAGGALAGGVLSGGAVAINAANTAHTGGNIKKGKSNVQLDDLVAAGVTTPETSRAYKLANEVNRMQQQGKRPGNYKVGALYKENLLNHADYSATEEGILQRENEEEMLKQALSRAKNTQAYKLAVQMQKKRENNQPLSGLELNRLHKAVQAEAQEDIDFKEDADRQAQYTQTQQMQTSRGKAHTEITQGMPVTGVQKKYVIQTQNAAGAIRTTAKYDGKIQYIQRVASTQNGDVKVELSGGKTVSINRIPIASEETRSVYQAAGRFGTAGANAFVDRYKGDLSVADYARDFEIFYAAGRQGRSYTAIVQMAPVIPEVMGHDVTQAAYLAGIQDVQATLHTQQRQLQRARGDKEPAKGKLYVSVANVEKLSSTVKAQVEILRAIADEYGVNIKLTDNPAENKKYAGKINGVYIGANNIVIHTDADAGALAAIAFHEIGHYIHAYNPEGFKVLSDFVVGRLESKKGYDIETRIGQLQDVTFEKTGRWISEEEALEEIVCNSLSSVAADPDAIDAALQLTAKQKKSLIEVLKDFGKRLRAIFSDFAKRNAEAAQMIDDSKSIMKMAKLLQESIYEAGQNVTARADVKDKGSVRYSIKNTRSLSWREQLDRYFSGNLKSSDSLYLGKTPDYLQAVQVEPAPVYVPTSVITKGMRLKKENSRSAHGLPKQIFENLQDSMYNPVAVIYNPAKTALVFITDKLEAGNPVVISMQTNQDLYGELAHKVTSVYPREHMGALLENLDNTATIFVANKNKFDHLLSSAEISEASELEANIKLTDESGKLLPGAGKSYSGLLAKSESDSIISDQNHSVNKEEDSIEALKFSLRETARTEYTDATEGDRQIARLNRILASMVQHTGSKQANVKALYTVGRKLLKEYASSYDLHTFVENYEKVFHYIANNPQANFTDAMQMCTDIAKAVIEKSSTLDTRLQEQYANLLGRLKKNRITLSDSQKQELSYAYGSYRAGRNRLFGRVNVTNEGEALTSMWVELSATYPELFDLHTPEAEQPLRLIEVLDALQPQYVNTYGKNIDAAAQDLAYRLYEEYFGIPEVKTQAQKQNNRFLLLKAQYADALQQTKQAYKKRYENKLREEKIKLKQNNTEVLAKAKAQAQAYYRELYQNSRAAARESMERKKYRDSIERTAMELYRWIIKPDKKRHVIQDLQKPIAEFLLSLDFVTPKLKADGEASMIRSRARIMQWTEAFQQLNHFLQQFDHTEVGGNSAAFLYSIDPEFKYRLSAFIDSYGGSKTINQMDAKQLKELAYIVRSVKSAVVHANDLHTNELYKHVEQAGKDTIDQTAIKKEKLYNAAWKRAAKNFLELGQMDSFSYFEHLGEAAYSIHKSLRKGFDTHVLNLKEAEEYFKRVKGNQKIELWTGKNAMHTFQVAGGSLTLSTTQIMGLYEAIKRPQAAAHILYGGIRPAAANGEASATPVRVTIQNVRKITSVLTPQQIALADALQSYMATTCARQGNETSKKLNGYEKFHEKNYYPVSVDKNSVATIKNNQNVALWSVINFGFTKDTVKDAANPFILSDIFDVYFKHVTEMSMYNSFAVPIIDAMKWYNYMDVKSGKSVKQGIERVYGKGGHAYFVKLIEDISAANRPEFESAFARSVMKKYKIAAVGANLSVVIQQPTAYIRAMAMVDPKYMAKALLHKPAVQRSKQYAPIALWKSWGFHDIAVGNSLKSVVTGIQTKGEKITDASMWLAGKADDVTWGYIFNACCEELKAMRPDLKVHSDAFYKAAAERFSDVVDRTQVVDTVLHKSHYMRNKNPFMQATAAFLSEPNKTYNLLRNALVKWTENKKNPAAIKNLVRVSLVVLLANYATALAKSVVDAFRDDDNDKTWAEKYAEKVLQNFIANSNPVGWLPVVNNLANWMNAKIYGLFTGDDSYYQYNSDMATEGIFRVIRSMEDWTEWFAGESEKSLYAVVSEAVKAASMLTGIPAGNLLRELETIYTAIVPDGIAWTEEDAIYQEMCNAIKQGDKNRYREKYQYLEERYKSLAEKKGEEVADTDQKIENGLAKYLAENSKEIQMAAEAFEAGDGDTYKKHIRALRELGFPTDVLMKAMNKRRTALKKDIAMQPATESYTTTTESD